MDLWSRSSPTCTAHTLKNSFFPQYSMYPTIRGPCSKHLPTSPSCCNQKKQPHFLPGWSTAWINRMYTNLGDSTKVAMHRHTQLYIFGTAWLDTCCCAANLSWTNKWNCGMFSCSQSRITNHRSPQAQILPKLLPVNTKYSLSLYMSTALMSYVQGIILYRMLTNSPLQ